jgi:hypothetical protein
LYEKLCLRNDFTLKSTLNEDFVNFVSGVYSFLQRTQTEEHLIALRSRFVVVTRKGWLSAALVVHVLDRCMKGAREDSRNERSQRG